MVARRGDLEVRTGDNEIEIGNDRVRARFYLQDGGYVQEFLAADRKGRLHLVLSSIHKNLIPSSEHRACVSPMVAGDRPHLFALTRDSLRMVYSRARIVRHDEQRVSAELAGSALGHSLKCTVALEAASNAFHVTVEDEIERGWSDPLVEYLMASYAFLPDGQPLRVGEQPDYVWAPNLRPAGDHVIGDSSFHSPAAIVRTGQIAAALVPDLDLLGKHRAMQTCLDLDLCNGLLPAPLLSFGFCGYEQIHGAGYSRHDVTHAKRIGGRLRFGCHLIMDAEARREPVGRQVGRFLWGRFGSMSERAASVSRLPSEREGRQPISHLALPDAWAACGMHALGMVGDDEGLMYHARGLVNTALSVPLDRGLFPTRYDAQRREWSGCNVDIGGAAYHTVECSSQLYWLLTWHKSVHEDSRILDLCKAYADFLLEARQRNGAIPSWYDREHVPLSLSRSGAQTAPSAAFLSRFAKVIGEKIYNDAAERSARFVLKEIMTRRLFFDGSLLNTAERWALECPDPHTGMRPASGMAMLWVALMCIELGDLTSGPSPGRRGEYLAAGWEMLDELCLLQSVWSKQWAPQHLEYGSLAHGNVGAKYDPELTAEFARCAMAYGSITGKHDYFDRGAAALRAVIREPGLGALAQARVAASVAEVESRFGDAYVHVAGKWAAALNGWQVRALDIGNGAVSLRVDGSPAGGSGRIVFGGMRGKCYRVAINGRGTSFSREEMERGIEFSGSSPRRRATRGQLVLTAE